MLPEDSQLRLVAEILAADGEINLLHYKSSTLKRRIQHRCSSVNCNSIQDYIQYLQTSEEERQKLRQDLLISVTSFFRDPEAWEFLAVNVIPQLLEETEPNGQIRCWVAACATGEEAYSLAILLDEAIQKHHSPINFTIFATDIDSTALQQASRGIYPSSISHEITPEHLARYFINRDESCQIIKHLREKIVFAPHNLVQDVGFIDMNLVTCRNVLIYLQAEFQQQVIKMLHFALTNRGKLFLGKSENLGKLEAEFLPLSKVWNIYEKRRNIRLTLPFKNNYETITPTYPNKISLKERTRPIFEPMLSSAFKAFLIDREMTCFLVNSDYKLLYLVEDLAPVLQLPKGESTSDVTKIVIPPLQLLLKTALERAKKDNRTVYYQGLRLTEQDNSPSWKMTVNYHNNSVLGEDFFMVMIEKQDIVADNIQPLELNAEANQRILDLETDLNQTQTILESAIEELEVKQEEHQAIHEELIASNEELKSTNEELHSVNAELYTINNDYQRKIQEITQLTNDVENLLNATNIGVIFLDQELKIRKFTPAATQAINLVVTDIGRPIHHLSHNLTADNFISLLEEALTAKKIKKHEVKLKDIDTYLLLQIYPYSVPNQQKIDGLVLNFVDINDIKQSQKKLETINLELHQNQAQTQAIIDNSSAAIYIKDIQGRYILVNRKCESLIGKKDVVIGKTDFELLPPEIAGVIWSHDCTVIENNAAFNFEEESTINGVLHSYIAVKFPLYDQNQKIYAVCGISTDITQIKQTEAALRHSQTLNQAIIDNSSAAIYVKDIQGKYILINRQSEYLTCLTNDMVIGKTDFELFPPEMANSFWNNDRTVIENNSAFNFQEEANINGVLHSYIAVKFPLYDQNQKIYAVCGISTDITQIKQTEAALRHSQALNQAIAKALPELIIRVHRNGTYLDFNVPENFPILAPEKERIGINIQDALPPEVAQQRMAYIELTLATGKTQSYELQREINNQLYWQEESFVPNGADEVIIVVRDIGSRKQIELALKESEERYALATKASGEGLWEWNLQTNQAYVSARYEEILGYKNQEVTWTYEFWQSLLHPEDREWVLNAMSTHLTQKLPHDIEFRIRKKTGEYLWVHSAGQAVWNEADEPIRMVGSLQDITERKNAQTELQKLTQELQRLNLELETRVETRTAQLQAANDKLTLANAELARSTRLKDEFLANMSHELRTPLNAILGRTEILQEGIHGNLNEAQLSALTTIENSGYHLLSLINDILDLAKIEAGKIELTILPTNIKLLCESSLAFVKEQALKKGIQLNFSIPENLVRINLDELRMRQVLINLLSNAVKFTPAGGNVSLEVEIDNSLWLMILVKDTGIGIASENLESLFQAFVQIDSGLSRNYEGTGLGLALVKKLVTLHCGTVTVTSKLGQGSCFTIRLPYAANESVENQSLTDLQQLTGSAATSTLLVNEIPLILLAEDNPDNIQLTQDYLSHFGYEVIVAVNGSEAVAMAKMQKPQLILMDIQMPEIDGLEVIRQIRSDESLVSVPIIALTALAMRGDRESCLAAGASDYLSKPVSMRILRAKIEHWLSIRSW
ncbi:CheR family methyltransferase [Anabaena azotica]|uniref:CheR family methyltransferase n=1 Tax=Anabaena azotica TaxID=197653 RepID=UPI0039A400CA